MSERVRKNKKVFLREFMETKRKIKKIINFFLAAIILFLGTAGVVFSVQAYPQVFKADACLEKRENINVEEAVAVKFSEPMIPETVAKGIKVNPETAVDYQWRDHNKTLLIFPQKSWKIEQLYSVEITEGKSVMLTPVNENLEFKTISYPQVEEFYPSAGEEDIVVDMEDPIRLSFDKSISGYEVRITISPFQELVYEIDSSEKEIQFLPKGDLAKGERYRIQVYIKHRKENKYRSVLATDFKTKPPAPAEWSADFATRLTQAKKFTEAAVAEGKYIDISLKNQIMVIFQEGEALDAFLISSGKRGMDTPKGSFQIHNKYPRTWSRKYKLFMPYWMAFVGSGQFGIHELPEWPGGYKEGANHLGTPVSHGCVRLGVGSAEKVYEWAEIGTPVIIHD